MPKKVRCGNKQCAKMVEPPLENGLCPDCNKLRKEGKLAGTRTIKGNAGHHTGLSSQHN